MKKIVLFLFVMLFGIAANAQEFRASGNRSSIPLNSNRNNSSSNILSTKLQWCIDTIGEGVGLTNGLQNDISAAIGFTPTNLVGYENNAIYSLSIGIHPGNSVITDSKIFIIEDDINNPYVYEQNCNLTSGWNEITLNTPYFINGTKTIYIGYESNVSAAYPYVLGFDNSGSNIINSAWIKSSSAALAWNDYHGNWGALNIIANLTPSAPPITGNGTLANPYIIKNNSNLNAVANFVNNGQPNAFIAFYNDSIINGANNTSIGNSTNPFKGKVVFVDGAGNPVNNGSVTINGITNPLFGNTDEATINKITLTGVNINTSSNNVGALVNIANNSIIDSCYSSGNITGNNNVGGLIGNGNSCTHITNCHSTATVTGIEYVGGLIGKMDGCSVRKSYSIGNVSGNDKVGGLLGSNDHGTVLKCYSKGNVNRLAGTEKLFGKLIGTGAGNEVGCFYLITATSPIDAMSNYRGTASSTPEEALN
jgi:hypothetical protein